MFDKFDYFNRGYIFGVKTDKYKPYINYSWSQTLTVGGSQQIKDSGTAGLNLQQFFGQGCWFNGIDMQVTIPVNETIQTEINRVNGVVKINTNTQNLTNYKIYSGSGVKVYKDLYLFNRPLTQAEIDKYNNQPNQFFMDSLEDTTCILAVPMCEKNNLVRNYKNNTDYPITNYLTTCRIKAQRLPYGLQTSGFKRDSNGLILSKSNFLECDGVGYGDTGWIPNINKDETLEIILDSSKDSIEISGCETLKGFNVGSYELTPNKAYVRVHGSATVSFSTLTAISLVTIPYNAITRTFDIYNNGVLLSGGIATTAINNTIRTFRIGNRDGSFPVTTPIRLFKVHNKVLTQAEITKNFNKYQAQGLLNE